MNSVCSTGQGCCLTPSSELLQRDGSYSFIVDVICFANIEYRPVNNILLFMAHINICMDILVIRVVLTTGICMVIRI